MSFNRLFIALSENMQFICQKVISFDLNRLKVVQCILSNNTVFQKLKCATLPYDTDRKMTKESEQWWCF